jgi:iron-sulfur cluster protein
MGYAELEKLVSAALARGRVRGLYEAMVRGLTGRERAIAEFEDYGSFRRKVREVKERSVEELEGLVEEFVRNAEARGARVHYAADAEDACNIILRIIEQSGGKKMVKSKSLTSEEIELNDRLEREGIEVLETDLGERIIQLAREKPSHLVFPAIHKTVGDVAELFSAEAGRKLEPEIGALLTYIRSRLRREFLDADVGLNGANVAIAELGAVVLETNEGNGRLVASLPRVQIVLVGIEKVVRTVEEALMLARSHAVAATGQRLTVYVSIMGGRMPLRDAEGRELHIVLLDNGRRRMREDPFFREALYCIRCGACMNVCAPYSVVGGHVFGHIYPGPIGIPWTANVHGLEKASFAHLCISCGLCKEVCPVEINIPMMIARVKEMEAEVHGFPRVNRVMMAYERFGGLASRLAPISNRAIRSRAVRWLMEKLLGLDRDVELPAFDRRTLRARLRSVRRRPENPVMKVALFPDFFYEYVRPDIAEGLIVLLQEAGVEVEVPPVKTSGYPLVAYGDLKGARRYAERNVRVLREYASKGYLIVSLEPTATYALKFVYPYLLRDRDSMVVSEMTVEALALLRDLLRSGRISLKPVSGRYGVHVPCHQRALSGAEHVTRLLSSAGAEVEVIGDGMCCGMAGTFGMKAGPIGRGLSLAMGERLFSMFKSRELDAIVTESSVCAIHLKEGTGMRVMHPLELLRFEVNR